MFSKWKCNIYLFLSTTYASDNFLFGHECQTGRSWCYSIHTAPWYFEAIMHLWFLGERSGLRSKDRANEDTILERYDWTRFQGKNTFIWFFFLSIFSVEIVRVKPQVYIPKRRTLIQVLPPAMCTPNSLPPAHAYSPILLLATHAYMQLDLYAYTLAVQLQFSGKMHICMSR